MVMIQYKNWIPIIGAILLVLVLAKESNAFLLSQEKLNIESLGNTDINITTTNFVSKTPISRGHSLAARASGSLFYPSFSSLILLVISMCSLVYGFFQWRFRFLLAEKLILEQQVANYTAQQTKSFDDIAIQKNIYTLIAHDIKTPLQSFRNLSEKIAYLLKKGEYNRLKEVGNHIEHSSFSVLTMVDNLLAMGIVEQNLIEQNNVETNILEVTNRAISDFQLLINKKNITIQQDIPFHLSCAKIEPFLVYLLFKNIIHNAIKYSNVGSKVLINARLESEQIVYTVQDFGIGIDASTLSNLFENRKLQSESGTLGEKGSGVGLLLCRKVLHNIGGRLEVESIKNSHTKVHIRL